MYNNQELLSFTISFIPVTLIFDSRVILLGEIRSSFLLGEEGLKKLIIEKKEPVLSCSFEAHLHVSIIADECFALINYYMVNTLSPLADCYFNPGRALQAVVDCQPTLLGILAKAQNDILTIVCIDLSNSPNNTQSHPQHQMFAHILQTLSLWPSCQMSHTHKKACLLLQEKKIPGTKLQFDVSSPLQKSKKAVKYEFTKNWHGM